MKEKYMGHIINIRRTHTHTHSMIEMELLELNGNVEKYKNCKYIIEKMIYKKLRLKF